MTPEGAVLHGDCLELLPTLDAESIDAIATDPPYGLEFMGKDWDSFRVDERSARWASRSGSAGEFGQSHLGAQLPSYTRRRTTSTCLTCGKRDAFRNPHACGDTADWRTIYVDTKPVELRAFQNWVETWAAELYRVAKPGAHLLAFGGTRTYHRLACGIEEAGWEVRDCLVWGYASGFPKSMDVSRQLDRRAGVTRELAEDPIAGRTCVDLAAGRPCGGHGDAGRSQSGETIHHPATVPTSPEAIAWAGWGTALKPAWEPIILARKPLTGSVAENVLRHGTGALNIDGTRIPVPEGDPVTEAVYLDKPTMIYGGNWPEPPADGRVSMAPPPGGRWPPNVILTDPIFDGGVEGVIGGGYQSGGGTPQRRNVGEDGRIAYGEGWHGAATGRAPVDTAGSYSRFFLVPKADRLDREPVLAGTLAANGDGRENHHPTVKPVELMRHLVRLVTPPGGLVLDPFLGSGTTAIAAENEGFRWLGIERDAEYVAIAEARLNGTQRGLGIA